MDRKVPCHNDISFAQVTLLQNKLSCRSYPEENYPEWKYAMIISSSCLITTIQNDGLFMTYKGKQKRNTKLNCH